jgi:hypothetical protein
VRKRPLKLTILRVGFEMVKINIPALTVLEMKTRLRELFTDEVAMMRGMEQLTRSGIVAPGETPAMTRSKCSSDEKVLEEAMLVSKTAGNGRFAESLVVEIVLGKRRARSY